MSESVKIVSENRKARFDYHIIERFEAGLVLTGAEIKSIRAGEGTVNEAYVRPQGGELFLLNAYIKPYSHSGDKDYDPRRPRKLLMNKREITKLIRELETAGTTIVPLDIHLKNGLAKLEIALGKGKAAPDKRQDIKKREAARDVAREMSKRSKS
ncbi:MAG: SsrA-binding protein SmpB [Pseudomonadota bacterium]|jgi:SsrA-binding protein